MEYKKYFEIKERPVTKQSFIVLADNAPKELRDLVWSIHDNLHCDMPNDWIYGMIAEAFDVLAENSLDDINMEGDIYNRDLIEWLHEPFALAICEEAREGGLVGVETCIIERIRWGQWLAKRNIYVEVEEFLKESDQDKDRANYLNPKKQED